MNELIMILKEYHSLKISSLDIEKSIESEKERLILIDSKIKHKQKEALELEENIKTNEKELIQDEESFKKTIQTLEQKKQQYDQIKDNKQLASLEQHIKELTDTQKTLEEKIFRSMELLEEMSEQKKNCETFQIGASESIKIIENEVEEINKQYQIHIDSNLARLAELEKEIEENILRRYQKAWNKFKETALSKINNRCCDFCGSQISQQEYQVFMRSPEPLSCAGCSRLLIPNP
jgi:predicted  nucleic acid-binding Zn-ribbon protein